MIDRGHELQLSRQLYYAPRPVLAGELASMRRIDGLHLTYVFAGSRMLRAEDILNGRQKVATLK